MAKWEIRRKYVLLFEMRAIATRMLLELLVLYLCLLLSKTIKAVTLIYVFIYPWFGCYYNCS